ncbi:MAG TPA: hypothetical protein VML96_09125 [Egibacteraceae bacterium]|nr:hypothetical protein [Egibacteraceae bacterium]
MGMSTAAAADARIALLSGLIDDAGLFPPAALAMPMAVAEHSRADAGPYAWIQGRFLCPVERLGELVAALPLGADWGLGVIAGDIPLFGLEGRLERGLAQVAAAVESSGGRLRLQALEFRLPPEPVDVASVLRAVSSAARRVSLGSGVELYLEAPLGPSWIATPAMARAIAEARTGWPDGPCAPPGAKIRCGGTAETTASIAELASFIAACAAAGAPFKATAGLHHPLAHRDPVTGDHAHGFLNVAAATALLAGGALGPGELEDVLAETDPSVLSLSAHGLSWRGRWARAGVIARMRRERLRSYGSCSFAEPIDDLTALGVLPLEEDVA